MEKPDPVRDATKRLPRGHAYIEIRNAGATVRIDHPEREVAWLAEVLKIAIDNAADDFVRDRAELETE